MASWAQTPYSLTSEVLDRCDARLVRSYREGGRWHDVTADPGSVDDAVNALEPLRAVASLLERQRSDLTHMVAGYSYDEDQRPHSRTNLHRPQ